MKNGRPENTIVLKCLNIEMLRTNSVWRWVEEDFICPVEPSEFLPTDRGDLLVYAKFVTATNFRAEGWIGIGDNGDVYCVSLYVQNTVFAFNMEMKDWAAGEIKRLHRVIGDDPIFPLLYHTEQRHLKRGLIDGHFEIEL
jgi:hypothetical protein